MLFILLNLFFYFIGEIGIGKFILMDILFNIYFDFIFSIYDFLGVKLKVSIYGKFWGFFFYGGGVCEGGRG